MLQGIGENSLSLYTSVIPNPVDHAKVMQLAAFCSPIVNPLNTPSETRQLYLEIEEQGRRIAGLEAENKRLKERVEQLEEELRAHKKLKGKPKLKASRLNDSEPSEPPEGKRPGSAKRSKKQGFGVDTEWKIEPDGLPEGARFNQYREYDVQEIRIERHNIRFLLGEYILPDGRLLRAQLPPEYRNTGHYGPELVGYILHAHYHNRVPQPLIYEQLQEWNIDISTGQINRLLTEQLEVFHSEQASVLEVGLNSSEYVHTDDTSARQGSRNGYCTVVGNDWFSYFHSSLSKSRINFLELLQGNDLRYVLNEYSQQYLEGYALANKHWQSLEFGSTVLATDQSGWQTYLDRLGIVTPQAVRLVSEAALVGGLIDQGVSEHLIILSDGAGQFNVFIHALCWIHAERALRKLESSTDHERCNIEELRTALWNYYQELKAYQADPTPEEKDRLQRRYDQLFGRCYLKHESLNKVLEHFRVHKAELLRMLDFPDIPLHNNGAESDIREFVSRRKISGGTRSELGRKARDTMVGLKKTCRKLGVCFWQYLLSRLRADQTIAPLPDLIEQMTRTHQQVGSPA